MKDDLHRFVFCRRPERIISLLDICEIVPMRHQSRNFDLPRSEQLDEHRRGSSVYQTSRNSYTRPLKKCEYCR